MGSRVAKNPIAVPKSVAVTLTAGAITIKGKFGELHQTIHPLVDVTHVDSELRIAANNGDTQSNALAGTTRALLSNMVKGVSEGFTCKLVMKGVGYRAKAQGKTLNLAVGKSHPVDINMPAGITVDTPSQTEIVLTGADQQQLKQLAADIRSVRPPEPYKGKGIRYDGEDIVMKEGKKK